MLVDKIKKCVSILLPQYHNTKRLVLDRTFQSSQTTLAKADI